MRADIGVAQKKATDRTGIGSRFPFVALLTVAFAGLLTWTGCMAWAMNGIAWRSGTGEW